MTKHESVSACLWANQFCVPRATVSMFASRRDRPAALEFFCNRAQCGLTIGLSWNSRVPVVQVFVKWRDLHEDQRIPGASFATLCDALRARGPQPR